MNDARDFLSLLVMARDEEGKPIPDNLVFENVAGLLFAGFDVNLNFFRTFKVQILFVTHCLDLHYIIFKLDQVLNLFSRGRYSIMM